MDYQYFKVSDFVLDKKFQDWVLTPHPESNQFWEDWLRQYPEKTTVIDQARHILLGMVENGDELNDIEQNQIWKEIDNLTSDPELAPKQKIRSLRPSVPYQYHEPRRFWTFPRIGVVATLIIGIALYLIYKTYYLPAELPPAEQAIVKENPWGQRSLIYLSDGTEVLLNSGSKIRYFKNFSAEERSVVLEGEAFFEVARDSLRPFRVKAGGLVTQALGTSFNIRAFAHQPTEVALVHGKVSVQKENEEDSVHLIPGELALWDSNYTVLAKSAYDEKVVLSWKDGIIYFSHSTENEVMSTLEHWYGVSISLEGKSKKKWDYTGNFNRRSLEHVLLSISFAMDFSYEIDNKNIRIKYN